MNDSDLRIFEFILQRTVLAPEHQPTAPLSVNQIAVSVGFNRSTVMRSMRRLQDQDYVITVQDDEWWRHRESQVGPSQRLLEPVRAASGIDGHPATRTPTIKSGLHHGDCFDLFPKLGAGSIALVCTDLPTGTTDNHWDVPLDLEEFWERRVRRVLSPGGTVVIVAAFPYNIEVGSSNRAWLKHELIWSKPYNTGFLNASYGPLRSHESILVFCERSPVFHPQKSNGWEPYKKRRKASATENFHGPRNPSRTVSQGERFPTTVLTYGRDEESGFPTGKPVKLMEFLIRSYSNPGDLVLDPCTGSGSTAIACMNAGRTFVGLEQDIENFKKATERIRAHRATPGKVNGIPG